MNGDLVGYEFDVEGGTAHVTSDPAPGNDQYVTISVYPSIRGGGKGYTSVRLRSMVDAHRAWKLGAMEPHPGDADDALIDPDNPDTYPRGV
jgi:hypothetical protein